MATFKQVKENPQILEFIKKTESALEALSYTEHGLRHANLVSERARQIAREMGFDSRIEELAAIAGYCHDCANFLSRTYHNYLGAVLFHQVFQNDFNPEDLTLIIEAISNHDKGERISFSNLISAIVVLADKSDVHKSRVIAKPDEIKSDIHDRVNFATTDSRIRVNTATKSITLILKIDVKLVPIMEYFEIFTNRMIFCRKAAEFLGYEFGLVINNFKLL